MITPKAPKIFIQQNAFYAVEYLDEQGQPLKSSKIIRETIQTKNAARRTILFCPKCKQGSPAANYGIPKEAFIERFDADGNYIGRCPHCLSQIVLKTIGCRQTLNGIPLYLLNSRMTRLCDSLRYWPDEGDGKFTLEIRECDYRAYMINGYHIVPKDIIKTRYTFNKVTGQTYTFVGKKEANWHPKTITFTQRYWADFPELSQILSNEGLNDTGNPAINNYLSSLKPVEIGILTDALTYDVNLKTELRMIRQCASSRSFESLPLYMQKKSIKKRLAAHISMLPIYRALHTCGITDTNTMNKIVDEILTMPLLSQSSAIRNLTLFCEGHERAFFKTVQREAPKKDMAAFILRCLQNLIAVIDAANMFDELHEYNAEYHDFSGSIDEIHDKLVLVHRKTTMLNTPIRYTKQEKKFKQTIDGYRFMLPKNTWDLVDLGNAFSNCVASYGRAAVSKNAVIVYAMNGEAYEACIELRKHNERYCLNQLKGKHNRYVSPKTLDACKKWAEKCHIDYENCYDVNGAAQQEQTFNPDELPFF